MPLNNMLKNGWHQLITNERENYYTYVILSSRLLSKNLKITIYRTIILLLFCMGVKLGRWQQGRKGSWGCL